MMRRSGAALLEVLVALAILTTSMTSLIVLIGQSRETTASVARSERELRHASDFLGVVSLWTRADLDRRLGTREQGPWLLRVDRVAPTLYTLAILDSTGARELVATSVHRPEGGVR